MRSPRPLRPSLLFSLVATRLPPPLAALSSLQQARLSLRTPESTQNQLGAPPTRYAIRGDRTCSSHPPSMAPRIQDVLASIFLPAESIYADLDSNAASPPRSPLSAPPSRSPPRTLSPGLSTFVSATDDPFAPVSPSTSFRAPSSNRSGGGLGDSRSPFSHEPLESAFLPDGSPPPRRRRGLGSVAGLGGSGVGSSGIGNRSLMGLLGGTRYEPMGFHEGVGSVLEEEDEEGLERGRRDRDSMCASPLAVVLSS